MRFTEIHDYCWYADRNYSLSKSRKKRPAPADWVSAEEVSAFETTASNATPISPATSLDTEGSYAALAGLQGEAAIYSVDADQVERQVAVQEPVTDTLWTGSRVVFATSQGSVKVFESGQEVASLREHAGPATALSAHPSGDLIGSVGADKAMIFYDLREMKRVSRAYADSCEFSHGRSPP